MVVVEAGGLAGWTVRAVWQWAEVRLSVLGQQDRVLEGSRLW